MTKTFTPGYIRSLLSGYFDTVSRKGNVWTVKNSYFWGVTQDGSKTAEKVRSLLPAAKILDYGNHVHAFVGGAKTGSRQDSYFWVKFEVA